MMRRNNAAFTIVELLVVIAIIGILMALLLSAVQASREAARAISCQNNLKQIGLAVTNFHDVHQAYPPARLEPRPGDVPETSCGGLEPSWLVRILPFIEHENFYRQWDLYAPYASHPEPTRTHPVSVYICPSRRTAGRAVFRPQDPGQVASYNLAGLPSLAMIIPIGCPFCPPPIPVDDEPSDGAPPFDPDIVAGALGDYAGNHGDLSPGAVGAPTDFYLGGNGTGVIISSRARCVDGRPVDWVDRIRAASVRDGLSNTLLAGERHVLFGDLGRPPYDGPIFNGDHFPYSSRVAGPGAPLARSGRDPATELHSFGSWHPGRTHFVLVDGSVRGISNQIDPVVLGRLSQRNSGEPIGEPF